MLLFHGKYIPPQTVAPWTEATIEEQSIQNTRTHPDMVTRHERLQIISDRLNASLPLEGATFPENCLLPFGPGGPWGSAGFLLALFHDFPLLVSLLPEAPPPCHTLCTSY